MSEFAAYAPRPANDAAGPALEWTVRPARDEDLDTIAAIAAAREGEPLEKWRERMGRLLAEIRAGGRAALFVAERQGAIAGYGRVGYQVAEGDGGAGAVPEGWYLMGVVVRPEARRGGAGAALTRVRLAWIAERSPVAYYVANERNRVTIDLHRAFGFAEAARDVRVPGVRFDGGAGFLFRCDLTPRP